MRSVNLSRWWPGVVPAAEAGAGASQPPVARKGPRTPGALQGPNAMQIGSDVSSDLAGTEFAGTPSGWGCKRAKSHRTTSSWPVLPCPARPFVSLPRIVVGGHENKPRWRACCYGQSLTWLIATAPCSPVELLIHSCAVSPIGCFRRAACSSSFERTCEPSTETIRSPSWMSAAASWLPGLGGERSSTPSPIGKPGQPHASATIAMLFRTQRHAPMPHDGQMHRQKRPSAFNSRASAPGSIRAKTLSPSMWWARCRMARSHTSGSQRTRAVVYRSA